MTTANKITIVRILMVPAFVALILYYAQTGHAAYRWGALLAFAIATIADALDGYVARHFNQRSELGAILDPLADKLLLTAALILFTFRNNAFLERIPIWLTATVLGRDAITLIGMAVVHARKGKVKVRAHVTGKIATILLMATVLWILVGGNSQVLGWLIMATGFFTVASAIFYVMEGVRQFYSSFPVGDDVRNA